MNAVRPPPLNLSETRLKAYQLSLDNNNKLENNNNNSGGFSPNLQPATPPTFSDQSLNPFVPSRIGDYLILNPLEGSNLFRCLNASAKLEMLCKVVPVDKVRDCLSGHFRLDGHPNVNRVEEVLIGKNQAYLFYSTSHGDLHSWVRKQRRLQDDEAKLLFSQVAQAVAACHQAGIVLRDLKLRKFVFKDLQRTELKLETLDDGVVLEDVGSNDRLNDKHGCPVYVSPEILSPSGMPYSGKAADCWSLGVMLYTMLVGRYPFHDPDPSALFSKIRRGTYSLPESLSSKAKCLIRNLLRHDPEERLTAEEILDHPWLKSTSKSPRNNGLLLTDSHLHHPHLGRSGSSVGRTRLDEAKVPDQTVPDLAEEHSSMFN